MRKIFKDLINFLIDILPFIFGSASYGLAIFLLRNTNLEKIVISDDFVLMTIELILLVSYVLVFMFAGDRLRKYLRRIFKL